MGLAQTSCTLARAARERWARRPTSGLERGGIERAAASSWKGGRHVDAREVVGRYVVQNATTTGRGTAR